MRLVSYNQLFDMFGSDSPFNRDVKKHYHNQQRGRERFPVYMDLVKNEDGFKILAELPGMEKDKIKIVVDNGVLTISGERKRAENNGHKLIRSERFYGNFTRSFTMPEEIDKSGISADYKNGLLEVVLPLMEEEKPKEINVKVN